MEAGQNEQAIEYLKKAVASNPNYGNAYHNLGMCYDNLGKPREAITYYEKAAKLDDPAESLFSLGLSWDALGDSRKAKDYYKKSIDAFARKVKQMPNDAELLNRMSGVHYTLGQYKDALSLLQKSLKLNPEYADSYVGLGACYIELKQYPRAREALNKAKDLHRKQKNAAGLLEADEYLRQIP
jgi:tetratricopeptide (TPR) repeat protein